MSTTIELQLVLLFLITVFNVPQLNLIIHLWEHLIPDLDLEFNVLQSEWNKLYMSSNQFSQCYMLVWGDKRGTGKVRFVYWLWTWDSSLIIQIWDYSQCLKNFVVVTHVFLFCFLFFLYSEYFYSVICFQVISLNKTVSTYSQYYYSLTLWPTMLKVGKVHVLCEFVH